MKMKWYNVPNWFINTIAIIVIIIILFVAIIFTENNKPQTNSNIRITELTDKNDSIKITIKRLDSLKNEEIIEVKGFNNDSTLKLFKRLVSE